MDSADRNTERLGDRAPRLAGCAQHGNPRSIDGDARPSECFPFGARVSQSGSDAFDDQATF